MKNATLLPVDAAGNPLPVFAPQSKKTQTVTCTVAETVYASAAFSGSTRTREYISSGAADSAITFTANKDGEQKIRVKMTQSTAIAVSVSGRDITITYDDDPASTAEDIVDAVNDHAIASGLVTASFGGDGSGTTIVPISTLTYLEGWDEGNCSQIVRVWAEKASFIGLFPESGNETLTASMPVAAETETWVCLLPGEKIACKSADAGAKVYLTPGRIF